MLIFTLLSYDKHHGNGQQNVTLPNLKCILLEELLSRSRLIISCSRSTAHIKWIITLVRVWVKFREGKLGILMTGQYLKQ